MNNETIYTCPKCNVTINTDKIEILEDEELKQRIKDFNEKRKEYEKIVNEHNKNIRFYEFWKKKWCLRFYIIYNNIDYLPISDCSTIIASVTNKIKYIECSFCRYKNHIST